MRILEYFFAIIGACLSAILTIALVEGRNITLFPWPFIIILSLALAYSALRFKLDKLTPFERNFPKAAVRIAIGVLAGSLVVGVIVELVLSPGRIRESSEWAGGSVHAVSPGTTLDLFMEAHRFLAAHGFQETEAPANIFGMQTGLTTPNMVTLDYLGSYQGSEPFVFRLDIDRSGNSLNPSVEPTGTTDRKYDIQEKASRAFLDLFVTELKQSKNAVRM